MNARHDASYKHLFSSPKVVQHLIEGFLPAAKRLGRLDFTTLEKVSASYVSDELRERADDVIWRIKTDKDWLYLYFLIEFQSSIDPWMAVRLITYVGLLYQDLIKSGQIPGRRLPPVLPVVFYTGEVRWNAPTDIAELLPQDLPPELAKYLPRMSYVLIDENAYTDEALAGLKNVVAATIRLKRQQRPQDLARLTEALHRWFAGDAELERILSVWIREYLLRDLRPELNVPEAYDLGEITMQLAERFKLWEQEVAQKAMQQGLQQGAQKGRLEGEALALQRQLTHRFGPLPEWVQTRLRSASAEELDTWLERVLDATRLEDVFGA
jgi:predicted transposase/invertase (TIGR01784 family)